MCDAWSENYAAQINTFNSTTSDLQPTLVLFGSTDCGGTFFPEALSQVPSNPFVQAQRLVAGIDFALVPASLYIPFNFFTVVMTSQSGTYSSTFLGPVTLPNLTLVRWQTPASATANPTMASDPIHTITFSALQPWTSSLFEMCMGETRYVDAFPLSRYYPQSERCDYFMSQQFCNNPVNQANNPGPCACLIEEPGLEAESKKLGVTLPVVCFGEGCATERSYKTNNMMSQPCNLTICQQIISSTPGIINEGQDTIFCGGQFYKANGTIVAPSLTPLPAPSNQQQEGTPFYVWIMLGVSAVLFVVLVVLLFTERPPKEVSVLRQIRKMQTQRSAVHPSRTAWPETSATTLLPSADVNNFVEY